MQVLLTNATKYSKGILSEILDFVMGTGLIPADGEVWKTRRRYEAAFLGAHTLAKAREEGSLAQRCLHSPRMAPLSHG